MRSTLNERAAGAFLQHQFRTRGFHEGPFILTRSGAVCFDSLTVGQLAAGAATRQSCDTGLINEHLFRTGHYTRLFSHVRVLASRRS